MTIEIIRDVTEECRMPADTCAVLVRCPTLGGSEEYGFAGGAPAAQLYSGIRPLGWLSSQNTATDWIEWFDTMEEAEAALAEAAGCHAD